MILISEFKVNGYIFRGRNSGISFPSFLRNGINLKRKNMLLQGHILSFKGRAFFGENM